MTIPQEVEQVKNSIDEIFEYLNEPKTDVRKMAMELLAGLSDNELALKVMGLNPEKYITGIFSKISDQPEIAAHAWDSLTNYSVEKGVAIHLLDNHIDKILSCVRSKELVFTEAATRLLSNLTKFLDARPNILITHLPEFMDLMKAGNNHNRYCNYDYLACVLADSTNVHEGRLFFVQDLSKLQTILPELHSKSVLRRGGVAAIIKNSLFETDFHDAILEKEINDDFIITTLAGRLLDSKSSLSSEEIEKLPIELQLLENVEAESDLIIRSIIIEALIVLGSTLDGRNTMRAKEIYPILREWHKIEENYDLKLLIEKLVELLIRDEDLQS